jgi:hypothetical protein
MCPNYPNAAERKLGFLKIFIILDISNVSAIFWLGPLGTCKTMRKPPINDNVEVVHITASHLRLNSKD